MQGRLHRAALALAMRGLRIFPCAPRAKIPATSHGALDATVDRQVIERWWHDNPDFNVAVATGTASGIFILDVDGGEAETALRQLETLHGTLPPSVEVVTARGRHIWFKMPNTELRNSAGKLAPGLDIRASGGFALTPPSIHPSGKPYCRSVDTANAIAAPPDWLIARLVDTASCNEATPPSEWRQLATDGVAEGKRNDSIARLTGHLLRHYVDARVTLELVRTWNATRCRPPLADKEVVAIVNSIAGKELKRRQEAGHGR
jgi:Bifunctional DNA primase/polymerase, N-terminal/Primase C terminal 1 (PriCT-1)